MRNEMRAMAVLIDIQLKGSHPKIFDYMRPKIKPN